MIATLKTLKDTKGKKENFKFLTSFSTLLNKDYKGLVEHFDLETYNEALKEINEKYPIFVKYRDHSTIEALNTTGIRIYLSRNKKKDLSVEGLFFNESFTVDLNHILKEGDSRRWRTSGSVYLNELYLVTDIKAFTDYAFSKLDEKQETHIKNIKEDTSKLKEETVLHQTLIAKYGKEYNSTINSRAAVSLLEALELTDAKKKVEKIKALFELIQEEAIEKSNDHW